MNKTTLFLGAGASKAFGYPTTMEILPKILDACKEKTLFQNSSGNADLYHFLLKKMLIALSPGLEKFFSQKETALPVQLPVVTDLLSLLDHFIANGHDLRDWNFELNEKKFKLKKPNSILTRIGLKDLKVLFEWAIISVINGKEKAAGNSNLYKWVKQTNKWAGKPGGWKRTTGRNYTAIITSNYDFTVEQSLLSGRRRWNVDRYLDYGFSWREPIVSDQVYLRPHQPLYRLFKLHGSKDWLKCDRCGHIYINPSTELYELIFPNNKNDANSCHCGYWPLRPVMIAPSYLRSEFDTNLHDIWKSALEELRASHRWVIVGYSLPNEDFNIKSLFLRAFNGRMNKPEIIVVQRKTDAQDRYYQFFGEKNVLYCSGGAENFDFMRLADPTFKISFSAEEPGYKWINSTGSSHG